MREQAPAMFKQLRRTGTLEEHLAAKSREAHLMYDGLTANEVRLPNGLVRDQCAAAAAERQVMETLISFPSEAENAQVHMRPFIIDPPSAFAPIDELWRFLSSLDALPDVEEIRIERNRAAEALRRAIAFRTRHSRSVE
jgi:hypothetical protein